MKPFLIIAGLMLLGCGLALPWACTSTNNSAYPLAGVVPTRTFTPTVTFTPTSTGTPVYSTSPVTVVMGTSTFYPFGMSYDNGYLWITHWGACCSGPYFLDEYSTAGVLVTEMSTYNGSSAFGQLEDVKIGPDGTVYVADYGNNQIEVFSPAGTYQTAITGLTKVVSAVVNSTGTTLYLDEETTPPAILTYSINNSTTPKTFTYAGTFSTTGSGVGALSAPGFMALDSSNNVYVPNHALGNIVEYDPTGSNPVSFGSSVLINPWSLVVDSVGNVLAAQNSTPGFIQEFTPSGSGYAAGVTFGNNVLVVPRDLTLDGLGNLYVANNSGNQILEFKNIN